MKIAGIRYHRSIIISFFCAFIFTGVSQAQIFRVLEEEKRISVPFQLKGNLIIVDLIMDQLIPMKFIFDTGAENTLLFDRKYSDYLAFQYDRKIPVYGSNLDTAVNALVSRNVSLQLIGLPVLKTDMLVLETTPREFNIVLAWKFTAFLGPTFSGQFHSRSTTGEVKLPFTIPRNGKHDQKKNTTSFH